MKRWKKLKLPEHELQTDEMLEAIEAQKAHKAECDRRGVFCPEFPFAQKWLDGRRWENKPSLADIAGGKEPPKQWEAL
ncbi:MAG: hypothetical protein Q8R28_06560 [Dehalococcoidia bacterium]|nr:hypothetical protein [Dehalococcoidia bacterium]